MKRILNWTERLEGFLDDLIELRRHLHAHPELSGEEYQTAALVAGELRKIGWRVKEGVGRTGVVADLGTDRPCIGLRVDMDALPVEEQTGLAYTSKRQGVMHACGHDLHTTIGIGVARLLADEELPVGVRIIFQPAEELAQGAGWMRDEGAHLGLEALFGVHVFPELPVGSIGIRSGTLTAAAGELEIQILGEGGHGARPHDSVDAIWIAARVITGLQEAISRRLDALEPVVVSFGKIDGGSAFNVIADRVRLIGTVRCLDNTLNKHLPAWIEETVKGICSSFGAKALVKYRSIAPPVVNDPELIDLLKRSASSQLGTEKVLWLAKPSLGAEDFAEFLQDVPGAMFRLGVADTDGCAPLHSGKFCPSEDCLAVGIKVFTATLLEWINKRSELPLEHQ
ncbi:amidohydrolase [Prochlorococcus sp. MIT 1300]|uniref:amidohydrolase n=1 Tax=Prochlorococcus sp. MIT 1300 TaxID=3096218 RepID=UPI002A754CB6|nr:amidohydrolase [Prochlorococcus sp. MIT 1300]